MAISTQDGKRRQRQSKRREGAPQDPVGHRHGHIVSHAPGRLRVRLHEEHRDPAALATIEQQLSGQAGITSVTTNARTGSVLVQYDHGTLSKDGVTAMLFDVGVVARELLGAEEVPEDLGRGDGERRVADHSSTATGLLDALTDLDYRLSQLTNGKVDFKLLVPLGLGALAVRQILTSGLGLGTMPGYVLLWYTFDSFYKLHQRKSAAVVQEAAEQFLGQREDQAVDDGAEDTPSDDTPPA